MSIFFLYLRLCQELYGFAHWWEIGSVAFLSLSIETPTPLVLGVGVMFAPVTGFVTFVRFWSATQWELLCRRVLTLRKPSSRPSGSVPSAPPSSPRGNFFGSFASWVFFFFFFPPLRRAGEAGGVSGCTWCFVWGGFLPSRSISVEREGWWCLWTFVWGARACSLFSFSFGSGRGGGCPLAVDFLFSALLTSLSLPNSHRTFHNVRIRGRLRSLASAYYPPVVLVLRIVNHGRIRGPGHVGVARGCRSRSSSHSRSRGRGRRLQWSSAWLSSRARSRCGRSRSSDRYRSWRGGSRSRCDRSRSLDRYRAHRFHLGVTGGGLLTAPGRVINVRVFPARWGDRRDR